MNIAISSAERGGALYRFPPAARLWRAAPMLGLLNGCDGAPSRNILGSYFPSWMVCALVGIACLDRYPCPRSEESLQESLLPVIPP
jgi:hypothetical protein